MQFILLLTSILGAVVTNAQSLSMMSLLPDIIGYEMSLPPDFELGSVSMLAIEPGTFVTEAKATKTTKTTKGPSAKGSKEAKAKASKTKAPSPTTPISCLAQGSSCNFAYNQCCIGLVCGLNDVCELEPEDPAPSMSLSLSLSSP